MNNTPTERDVVSEAIRQEKIDFLGARIFGLREAADNQLLKIRRNYAKRTSIELMDEWQTYLAMRLDLWKAEDKYLRLTGNIYSEIPF